MVRRADHAIEAFVRQNFVRVARMAAQRALRGFRRFLRVAILEAVALHGGLSAICA